jgi:hypothetical protein
MLLFGPLPESDRTGVAGPVGMVRTVAGGPFSARQVEEREQLLADGTEAKRALTCQVYRDSAGRVRMEFRIEGGGESAEVVNLFDPVADLTIVLFPEQKIIGDRSRTPRSSSGEFQTWLPVAWLGGPLPKGGSQEQALGSRVIEGIEAQGTRWASEEQPTPAAFREKWSSEALGLILEQRLVGPTWAHTVRLQIFNRDEPDPALFVIPPDYTVQGR